MEFSIEVGDIVIPSTCPVLGIPIAHGVGNGRVPTSPSVDRIDPTQGYIAGNVEVISWRANFIKKDASKEELSQVSAYYNKRK